MIDLAGRTVLVTGATRGLGAALTRVLVSYGASVIGVGRSADKGDALKAELRSGPGRFEFHAADLADTTQSAAFCAAVLAHGKAPDVIINNAGVNIVRHFDRFSDAEWDRLLDTNLKAPFQLLRVFLPAMAKSGGGTIINIASINAKAGLSYMAAYNASKAGLLSLSRSIAVEYAAAGIASIGIILGGVQSEMSFEIAGQMRQAVGAPAQGDPHMKGGAMPAKHAAEALALLCTEAAKLFTGSEIALDGGISAGLLTSHAIYGAMR